MPSFFNARRGPNCHLAGHVRFIILPVTVLLVIWWLTSGSYGSIPGLYAQAPTPGIAAGPADTPGGLPFDEAEAQAIDGMIMCPVCPAETIDQAQVPLARQMRAIVRQKLSEGATRQEILDFFADRYGQSVIGAPPKSGVNLVAWLLPPVAVAAALLVGVWFLRTMSTGDPSKSMAQPGGGASSPESERGLEPYLEMVDRQLAPPGKLGGNSPSRADIPETGPSGGTDIGGDRHG
jgi:cytochrome c-type biogenesis protein CcmH